MLADQFYDVMMEGTGFCVCARKSTLRMLCHTYAAMHLQAHRCLEAWHVLWLPSIQTSAEAAWTLAQHFSRTCVKSMY